MGDMMEQLGGAYVTKAENETLRGEKMYSKRIASTLD